MSEISALRRSLLPPRDLVMQTMERIYRFRMTTTSGGNVSVRDDNDDIWITPARIDKGNLGRADIVCVAPGGAVDGRHRPSSEYPFHRAIYHARPDIRAIVHAHPVALVAFSISGRVPDTRLFQKTHDVCGHVGFAPYALPGSERLGANIAAAFARGHNCVVLENHGVVVGAGSMPAAFERFETLEFTAKTIIKASLLGDVRYLANDQLQLPVNTFEPLPALEAGAATTREKELRRELCEFVRRGYQQRLFISTEGSFSARLDRAAFLMTPSNADRHALGLEDIVLISGGAAECGKTPSRAARLHQAIYDLHPDVAAIANGYPVNASAFSVTGAALEARTIPESFLLLRDVQRIAYGMQFNDWNAAARQVTMRQPIALLENDGALVCGSSVLDAFDRLEVLECTAEALINSRPLGRVARMPDEVIAELVRAFDAPA